MKIYLLKKEEGEEEFFFCRFKKHIFLPIGKYLGKFTVKAAGVTQREFRIDMQIGVENFNSTSRCATSFIA